MKYLSKGCILLGILIVMLLFSVQTVEGFRFKSFKKKQKRKRVREQRLRQNTEDIAEIKKILEQKVDIPIQIDKNFAKK